MAQPCIAAPRTAQYESREIRVLQRAGQERAPPRRGHRRVAPEGHDPNQARGTNQAAKLRHCIVRQRPVPGADRHLGTAACYRPPQRAERAAELRARARGCDQNERS